MVLSGVFSFTISCWITSCTCIRALRIFQRGQLFQVDLVEQFAMQRGLQLLVCSGGDTDTACRSPAPTQAHIRSKAFVRSPLVILLLAIRRGPNHPRDP